MEIVILTGCISFKTRVNQKPRICALKIHIIIVQLVNCCMRSLRKPECPLYLSATLVTGAGNYVILTVTDLLHYDGTSVLLSVPTRSWRDLMT